MSKYRVTKTTTDPFDDLFYATHGSTGKATWEDEEDIPEHDEMDDEE